MKLYLVNTTRAKKLLLAKSNDGTWSMHPLCKQFDVWLTKQKTTDTLTLLVEKDKKETT